MLPLKTVIIIGYSLVISGNNQGPGNCNQPSQRPMLITLTETLIIKDITKTESTNCFILHCFEESNVKHTVAKNLN